MFPYGRNAAKILFNASNNNRTGVLCATESDVTGCVILISNKIEYLEK